MQIYLGAAQAKQILKSYSVSKSTQYELSIIANALTISTSFPSHKNIKHLQVVQFKRRSFHVPNQK